MGIGENDRCCFALAEPVIKQLERVVVGVDVDRNIQDRAGLIAQNRVVAAFVGLADLCPRVIGACSDRTLTMTFVIAFDFAPSRNELLGSLVRVREIGKQA